MQHTKQCACLQEPEHVEAFKVAAQPVSVQDLLAVVTDPHGCSHSS